MNRYFIVGTLLCFCCAFPSYGEDYSAKRHKMVEEVLADLAANGNPAPGPDVVQAMEKVERHRFVPDWLTRFAYINRPSHRPRADDFAACHRGADDRSDQGESR